MNDGTALESAGYDSHKKHIEKLQRVLGTNTSQCFPTEVGFNKADSGNLPEVDIFMIMDYFNVFRGTHGTPVTTPLGYTSLDFK
ncbi:hypothetical protein NQ317_004019 [Molorchus minor]|uniref:Uncharacterized protein n=1 Tax=Molorchus minor TaxID=1323400 RepID=A0ABQ9JTE8_9CUCU|nr:hypothetical protein NQ317_004019 [Molorchus minor]